MAAPAAPGFRPRLEPQFFDQISPSRISRLAHDQINKIIPVLLYQQVEQNECSQQAGVEMALLPNHNLILQLRQYLRTQLRRRDVRIKGHGKTALAAEEVDAFVLLIEGLVNKRTNSRQPLPAASAALMRPGAAGSGWRQSVRLFTRPSIRRTKGVYLYSSQSSLAMALYARIPPPELRPKIMAQLENKIVVEKQGHLDTGLLGTFIMLDLLIQENRNDLVDLIMGQTTYPGWGYLIKELGLKTWPETWSGWGSHVILVTATPGSWFYEGLGGILPDPANPGFRHFTLRPGIVKSVDWVKCSYQSPYGKIVSNWKREGDKLTMDVTIPANTTATVYVPARDAAGVTESGNPAIKAEGVKFLRMENDAAVYEVGSGCYSFCSEK